MDTGKGHLRHAKAQVLWRCKEGVPPNEGGGIQDFLRVTGSTSLHVGSLIGVIDVNAIMTPLERSTRELTLETLLPFSKIKLTAETCLDHSYKPSGKPNTEWIQSCGRHIANTNLDNHLHGIRINPGEEVRVSHACILVVWNWGSVSRPSSGDLQRCHSCPSYTSQHRPEAFPPLPFFILVPEVIHTKSLKTSSNKTSKAYT